MVWAIIWGILALACLVISIMQFNEKGFLFNNAYIWASQQECKTMDKKLYYHQSGVAFALCAAVFLFMSIESVFVTGWLWLAVGALAILLFVYAIKQARSGLPNA